MKMYKSVFVFLLFYGLLQAHEADGFVNARKALNISKPSNSSNKVDFITPHNPNFLFYQDCSEASNFKITNLAMKLEYIFVSKDDLDNLIDPSQYDCQFHVVKIDYEITCRNKLAYSGTEYLFSPSKIENNLWDGDRGKRMKREAYDWENFEPNYINADGSITQDVKHGVQWGQYTIAKIDTASILEKWEKQKVSIPDHKFMGTPSKLPRPVLLIHGLDSDYKVWGVEPLDSALSLQEQAIKIGKYNNASLPDMLARSNNLYTEDKDSIINGIEFNINNNGIYFFQSPGEKNKEGDWEDAKPDWGTNPNTSQSRALYEKIDSVMKDFYYEKQGIEWWLSDKYQIDLVGHSQGGLVIREMLRGLRENTGSFPQGVKNSANHINRIITVNTPHFGSTFATPYGSLNGIEQEFSGLAKLIGDLDKPVSRTLIEAEVDVDFWDKSSMLSREILDINPVLMYGLLGGTRLIIAGVVAATDVSLTIKGPYIGTYKSEVFIDIPGPWNKTMSDDITILKEYADKFRKTRNSGEHLYKNSFFMTRLNNGRDFFPMRPDGSKITMLPMYSDSTNKMIPDLFANMSEEADKLCTIKDKDPNCFAAGTALKNYIFTEKSYNISKPDFDNGLWDMLVSLQNDWLAKGDAVVEASSQKFYNREMDYSDLFSDTSYTFLAPRNYAIHDALAPWEPVLHGPFGKFEGSSRQGLDLLCALSPRCDNAFALAQQGGKNVVLKLSEIVSNGEFSERSLEVAEDFDLVPQYISKGIQAFSISTNGETVLTAKYEPGKGSSIILNYNGTEQTVLLLGPEFATQPSMSRKGDSVFVTFTNYSGQSFKESYFLLELPQNITATVITPVGSVMSPVIIGIGTASDPKTQEPPTPPPGHRLAPITLVVLHRESRGEHEANTSRPRFLVYNTTNDTLEFSKVAYYFTADPARKPNVVVDYPYVPVSVENLGGDKWRFVLDVGNQKIAPKAFYPSSDGWQIRMHYSDWFEYKHLDDWSADYSLGMVQLNRKIVVYGKNGKIIWGNEAPGFESEDNGIIPTPKGTIAWNDDSPWETNAFKPRVTVKNTGSVALSDYHAQLWFRVPSGKNLSIPSPDAWYTPESQASAKNVGDKVWVLDMCFDRHILYPNDSVSEGNIGLHLTDWSAFDKTVCGIVLKDKEGNILFGKEPSIAECENYDGPNLLQPQYSKRQKEGK